MASAGELGAGAVAAACGGDDDDDARGARRHRSAPATDAPRTTAAAGDRGADDGTEAHGRHRGAGSRRPHRRRASAVECETADDVSLQLQWFTQAQFAGYFAAIDQGYYDDHCLDVEILEGGVDIVPQQQLADGQVDFAIAWVPKALQTREQGADIVNIAQIFQRSGTLQVSFKDAGITTPADFAGKNIGNWGFGNEYEVFAALDRGRPRPGQRRQRSCSSSSTCSACSPATSTPPRR